MGPTQKTAARLEKSLTIATSYSLVCIHKNKDFEELRVSSLVFLVL